MFILVTIIIFGIFVVIAYWLFEDQIKAMLESMMSTSKGIVDGNLEGLENPNNRVPGT